VRVIPGRAELGSFEGISLAVAGSKGAFRNSRNTVLGNGVKLAKAMPMNASAIRRQTVCKCY